MQNKNRGFSVIEVIVSIVIVVVFAMAVLTLIGFKEPSSGQHTGIVTAVEKNGIFWPTYSAYVKTSAQSTQEDQYCVIDPAVIGQLQSDAQAVKEVTVSYNNGLFVWPWQCGSSDESIITAVN